MDRGSSQFKRRLFGRGFRMRARGIDALLISGAGFWEGHRSMLHVTCDLCGKDIVAGEDHRYVVKMEVFAGHDPAQITESDLDDDHMEAVSEMLRETEEEYADPNAAAPAYKNFRYDLCPECHKKFVRNPLSREPAQKFDFSEN